MPNCLSGIPDRCQIMILSSKKNPKHEECGRCKKGSAMSPDSQNAHRQERRKKMVFRGQTSKDHNFSLELVNAPGCSWIKIHILTFTCYQHSQIKQYCICITRIYSSHINSKSITSSSIFRCNKAPIV